ncbi:non-ribosomal peptide synthetase [Micromonospora tarensis]|uniref:Amino acid adenylation domain-containing protein n=1 Tax=Micromonospora tarensis TaxID=2806100 RepID=A0ABS1YJ70_9ACTN|nr:non-ribosomal peptide synthetase [Micromonospora tarensis]MBM0277466.1 amino acid adenylation domain-containing protein [Micromonospora tarensis]
MTADLVWDLTVSSSDGRSVARPQLIDGIIARAAERPFAHALVDGDRVLTYGELVTAAQGVAECLLVAGIDPGEPVGVPAVREADSIIAMLGALFAGAAFVPFDPNDPPQRLAQMVQDVSVRLCVADPDRYPRFASVGLTCLSVRVTESPTASSAAEPHTVARTGEATESDDELPAYVIHTSGTTGRAKGVAVPRRALDHFSRVSVAHFEMTPDDRALQFFSLAFDASIEDIFPPLLAGATIVLRDNEMVLSVDRFLERCAQWSITVLMLPTAFWHEMVDAMARDSLALPPTVRLVTIGGEQVRAERVEKWRRLPVHPGVRLVNEYGPTETTVTVTTDELAGPHAEPDAEEPTIGRPLPGVVVRIVDDGGKDVPFGESGELLLGGPTVAIGYLGQPERTAERFVTDADGGRFYRTGDRVRLRADGRLAFFGRMDRQLKVQGHRIEGAGVEQVLLSHPLVDDAVVDLDPASGLLVGYLILSAEAGDRDDEVLADIRRHANRQLPAYSVPHHLRRVAVFPRTDRDKVDVAALHREFAPSTGAPVGGGETETERGVLAIVGEVLGAEPDVVTPLLDLGAHSLAMVQIATRLARAFGVRPAVGELHGAVTVRGIAALVAEREVSEPQATPARAAGRMTAFQRDTWLAEQLHPGTALHTIGVRYRIVGVTDPVAVQAALDAVVSRHDALRARFRLDGDEPVMDFGAEARPVPMTVHRSDGADVAASRRDRAQTVFDPEVGNMLAATLILGDGEAELIVAVHHLVFDGWSAAVLADELAAALGGGELAPTVSFAEHLSRTSPDSLRYWAERLAGLDTDVSIPTDRPRPAVRSFRGDRVEAPIGADRFRRISAEAERAGTSPATVFLAGLQALVARMTGRSDITVLSPVAHRTEVDSERAIGAYLTVVPLRTEVAAGADFRQIVALAHDAVLGALDHDDPPLADLPAALGIPARSGRSPFGQVSLMVHNTPSAVARYGDIAVEFVGSTHPERTKLDLTFSIDFPAGEPVLYLEYATELYDRATAARLVEQFLVLLDEVTADPTRPVIETRSTAEATADPAGHWRRRLAETDVTAELPSDRPRPRSRPFAAARVARALDPALTAGLAAAGGSVPAAVAAGLAIVLARYTGCARPALVAPVWNAAEGSAPLLPIVADVDAALSFGDVARRLHGDYLQDLAHRDVPAAELVAAAGRTADAGRNPLGDVVFGVLSANAEDCGSRGDDVPAEIAADLVVTLRTDPSGTALDIDYATAMFDRGRIECLADSVLTVLGAAADRPDLPVGGLPLLSDAEQDRILHDWGADDLAVPPTEALHLLFERHAAETPDAPALTFRSETISYGELNRRANRLAHYLRERGIGREDRVAICLDRGPDVFVAMWAVLKSGGGYVPLDPDYPAERLRFMLEDSAPAILLTRQARTEAVPVPAGVQVVALDRDSERIAGLPDTDPVPVTRSSDAAYLIYTSGSSGRPKGVTVEHGHLVHAATMWQEAYRLRAEWTYQQAASFSFDMFVGETLRAHCTGGRLVIVPRETLLDPAELYDLMRTERVSCTELVPTVLRRLLAHAETQPERLEFVELLIGGGEKWDVQDFRRARRVVGPRCRVINAYGVTEVTVDNVYFDGDVDDLSDDAPLPIGRPFPRNRVYVLDANGSAVPPGIVGEMYLGGNGVARGYHERPELDADVFVPDPFSPAPGARMYRTGDAARWRRDGVVEYLGRLDQQVKINGYRVELGEVEAVLATLPGVATAAAAVHRGAGGHAYLVGYVVGGDDTPPSESSLRERMATLVPGHLVPSRIVVVPALPQTPNGKIDRAALPEPARQLPPDREPTPCEIEVTAVWREVLGLGDEAAIGVDDNFFELGGDSFSALRIVRRLDPRPPLLTLYQNPTVAGVATWMNGTAAGGGRTDRLLHRLTRGEADPVAGGITVVAVPYSGGSAVAYQPVADALPDGWALYAAELPGHEWARPDEPLLGVEETAARIADEVRSIRGPVLLYGHCLGVAITVEVARRLERDGVELAGVALGAAFPTARLPGRLFDLVYRLIPQDRLVSNREYLAYLRGRGGFTDIEDPEQQAFLLRNVRHDAQGAEEYFTALFRRADQARLRAPVLSLIGGRDRVTELHEERYREWEPLAERVDLAVIPRAGHFFVRTHATQLAQALVTHVAAARSEESARPDSDEPVPASREPSRQPHGPTPGLGRFAAVAGGQLISMLGSAIAALVLSIWVFRQTGSITQFAVVSALGMLPGIVASPFAGAAADRWDRRKLMLIGDIGGAAAMATVAALALSGELRLWHVYLAVTAASLVVAFQRPAYLAAVAQLVPKRYLGRTNGITQLGTGTGLIFAPMLGVPLMNTIGVGGVIAIDLGTYLVAIVTVLAVRFPDRLFRRREERFTSEITGGWRYIAQRPPLLASLRYFIVDNIFFLLGFAVIMPLLLSEQSPIALSAALTAAGLGTVTAGLVMGLSGGTARRADGMLLFMGVCSLGMVGIGVSTSPVLVVCGMFLMAFGESMATAHWLTLLQVKVGFDLQGRVLSFFLTVMLLTEPLSYLVVGPFADAVMRPLLEPGAPLAHVFGPLLGTGATRGLALLLVLSGVLQLGWAVRGWFYRPVRRIEELLPDAIPPDELGDRDELQRLADSRLTSRS